MKFKAKTYREFILGCVKLYGAINSNDAFGIFKNYFKDATKKDFLDDLKQRSQRPFTKDYLIWTTSKRNEYLITGERIYEEEIDAYLSLQADKSFYLPQTYEEFLNCVSYQKWKEGNYKAVNKLIEILSNAHKDHNAVFADLSISVLYEDIRGMDIVKDINPIEMCLKRLSLWEYEIDDNNIEPLINCFQNLMNNIRYGSNRGHTPLELLEMRGPIDINKVTMSLGPNTREMFANGELDIKEYIDGIINSDLPPSIKQSLMKELLEIQKEIEETPKA